MGTFKSIDDIQREKIEREHREMKEKVVKETSDLLKNIGDNIRKDKEERKKKRSPITKFFIRILLFIAFLFSLNLLLLNVWVLKWVIKSLFFG